MARYTDYNTKLIRKKLREYMRDNIDYEEPIMTRQTARGNVEYIRKTTVKLPTIEGFAKYIGVARKTLYNWAKENPEFQEELEKILTEQQTRLINRGLDGTYNPLIAKLILSSNHGMRDGIDTTTNGDSINTTFSDEQAERIARRITGGKKSAGNTSGKK